MQKTITRNQLYQIEQEINSIQRESPALALLLSNRIKLFHERAGMQLKLMHARFNAIQDKYVQKDEHGNYLVSGEGDQKEWKYIESKIDLERAQVLDVSMVKEAFNKECQAFFMQTIAFEW